MNALANAVLAALKARSIAATEETRSRLPEVRPPPEYSEKAIKVLGFIRNSGWSQARKEALAGALGVIMDVDLMAAIAVRQNNFVFIQYAMVVPLRNQGGHSYALGAPVMIYSSGHRAAISSNIVTGGSLDQQLESNRVATTEEINTWFTGISDRYLSTLFTTLGSQAINELMTNGEE